VEDIKGNIRDIITAWKILSKLNLIDTIFNHISCVAGDEKALKMIMNPDGFLPEQVSERNISVFSLKKHLKKDAEQLKVNFDGLRLHSELHLIRNRAGVIIHTHSPYTIAVGNYKHGLLPLSQTAIEFVNDIEIVDYDGVFRKNALSEKLKSFAKVGGIAVLRHHGALIIADNVEEATYLTYYIEEACKIQVLSLAQGLPFSTSSKQTIKATHQTLKKDRKRVAKDFFNAFKRKLNNE
jgi:ribulose-5-phosphate 4-epimerase/fuculose-1-phosphate aldolase